LGRGSFIFAAALGGFAGVRCRSHLPPSRQVRYRSGDQELIKIGKKTYYRGGNDPLMPACVRRDESVVASTIEDDRIAAIVL